MRSVAELPVMMQRPSKHESIYIYYIDGLHPNSDGLHLTAMASYGFPRAIAVGMYRLHEISNSSLRLFQVQEEKTDIK